MTLKLAYNTSDSPALVDAAGYQIGGRSWGPVDSTDPIYQAEAAAGRLVDADEQALAASDNADAHAAVAALRAREREAAELAEREAAARELSKSKLAAALPAEQVEAMDATGDGLPAKNELVEAVAASDEPVPAPEPETTTSKRRTAAK